MIRGKIFSAVRISVSLLSFAILTAPLEDVRAASSGNAIGPSTTGGAIFHSFQRKGFYTGQSWAISPYQASHDLSGVVFQF